MGKIMNIKNRQNDEPNEQMKYKTLLKNTILKRTSYKLLLVLDKLLDKLLAITVKQRILILILIAMVVTIHSIELSFIVFLRIVYIYIDNKD